MRTGASGKDTSRSRPAPNRRFRTRRRAGRSPSAEAASGCGLAGPGRPCGCPSRCGPRSRCRARRGRWCGRCACAFGLVTYVGRVTGSGSHSAAAVRGRARRPPAAADRDAVGVLARRSPRHRLVGGLASSAGPGRPAQPTAGTSAAGGRGARGLGTRRARAAGPGSPARDGPPGAAGRRPARRARGGPGCGTAPGRRASGRPGRPPTTRAGRRARPRPPCRPRTAAGTRGCDAGAGPRPPRGRRGRRPGGAGATAGTGADGAAARTARPGPRRQAPRGDDGRGHPRRRRGHHEPGVPGADRLATGQHPRRGGEVVDGAGAGHLVVVAQRLGDQEHGPGDGEKNEDDP